MQESEHSKEQENNLQQQIDYLHERVELLEREREEYHRKQVWDRVGF